jgi:hypothetical protein
MTPKISFEIKEELQDSAILTYRYRWYAKTRNNTLIASSIKNFESSPDALRSAKTFLSNLGVPIENIPMTVVSASFK